MQRFIEFASTAIEGAVDSPSVSITPLSASTTIEFPN
jgi:hypothetical protein